jgi:alanine-glyoxylate transaminase/serine-glyoxylate transaminase/serine-pyruvate transaminase
VDEAAVRTKLLSDFHIEVGAGLGSLKGKVWRVGLMGESSTRENVRLFLSALCQCLNEAGYPVDSGAALAAAS